MIASLDNFFFSFSQNPIRNQEIFTVLLVAIAIDSFCSSFWHQENPKKPSYISLQNKLLRILKLPSAIGQCYDNAATVSKKKSGITTQIKNLHGKCFHTYYHGEVLDLNIDHMEKKKQV